MNRTTKPDESEDEPETDGDEDSDDDSEPVNSEEVLLQKLEPGIISAAEYKRRKMAALQS